jgi:hypothetical protein
VDPLWNVRQSQIFPLVSPLKTATLHSVDAPSIVLSLVCRCGEATLQRVFDLNQTSIDDISL